MTQKQYLYCFLLSFLNTLLLILFPDLYPLYVFIVPIPGALLCLAIIGIDIYRGTSLWKPFLYIYALWWMSFGLAICFWVIRNRYFL
jgi:hypothetical protein